MKHLLLRLTMRCFTLLLLIIICSLSSIAQEFIFNHFTTKDGLSSNSVFCVTRDSQGYLWIGTETGLQRYDGYNFIYPRFTVNDKSTFSHTIHEIAEDRKGRMWLRMGSTIGIFDTHTFEFRVTPLHFSHPAFVLDYRLLKDADGKVFVVAIGACWFVFNEKTFSFEEKETPFSLPASFHVNYMADDKKAGIFWACGGGGLMAYDKKKKTLYTSAYNPDSLPLLNNPKLNHYVNRMFIDNKRRYWIVNWDMEPGHIRQNLYCYDEKTKILTNEADDVEELATRYYEFDKILQFDHSNVIVYGRGCLALNRGNGFKNFNDTIRSFYNISYSVVNDVFEDKDSLLWIATDNGLYNTEAIAKQNQHLILDENKKHAEIDCMYPYKNKNDEEEIWIGTWGGRGVITLGTNIYTDSHTKLYDHDILNTDYSSVWGIAQNSRDGRVWMTCQHGLLQIFNPATGKSDYLRPTPFAGRTIRNVVEDKQGNLWFGVQSGDIVKWNYGSTTADSSFHVVANTGSMVFDLFVDSKGLLWTCSPAKGVIVFDPKTNKTHSSLYRWQRSWQFVG